MIPTDTDADVADLVNDRRVRALHRSRRRRVVVLVLLLVVVPLGVVGVGGGWVWWQLDPPGKAGDSVEIEVTKGWGVPEIADELTSRDIIGSSIVFQAYSRLRGAGPFQAGTYEMRRHLGVREAVAVLEAGPQLEAVDLAVIPGQRISEIGQEVEKQVPWLDGAEFVELAQSGEVRSQFQPEGSNNLEGLLWPDTYRVAETETELDVLRTMVQQFDRRATAAGLEGASVQGLGAYDLITLASLIQSEAGVEPDRPLIASVIYNRLREDMLLQIDATVLYATGKRSGITRADLQVESPYNTYVVKGLPPTPISGVTTASLEAALAPATTGFFYYVIASSDGSHAFAPTFAEHERNIEKAREAGLL